MTRPVFVMIGLLLALPSPAAAHLLDEYLQATRIEVARDRVVLEIDLTPGMAVAPGVVALIDRNGDGQISPAEIETYAEQVLSDLALEIDGRRYPLTLTRAEGPSPAELREGLGTIRLEATAFARVTARHDAAMPAGEFGDGGRHRIRYENAHQRAISVYLVNALVPAARAIAMTAERRDVRQHGIELDVEVAGTRGWSSWLLFTGVGLAALAAFRRREAGSS